MAICSSKFKSTAVSATTPALPVVENHEAEHEAATPHEHALAGSIRIASLRPSDGPMSDSFDGEMGAGNAPLLKHELELLRLRELHLGIALAERDARVPAADLSPCGCDGKRIDDVIEDDREAPLHVRAR